MGMIVESLLKVVIINIKKITVKNTKSGLGL